jgi:hypothetical protein
LFLWEIIVNLQANLNLAIFYTFTGKFEMAKEILNPQWLLNLASVYLFAMYDAYTNTVENNKLYEWEQSKFFEKHYQNKNFNIPSKRRANGGIGMHIIATFEHSLYLKQAITAIQMKGIAKKDILAVPMDKRNEERKLFDTMHQSDGFSLIDLASILGTILMLLGTIYGFTLKWGPIFWGLVGLIVGFGIGLIIKLFITKKYNHRHGQNKTTEDVLIIECSNL